MKLQLVERHGHKGSHLGATAARLTMFWRAQHVVHVLGAGIYNIRVQYRPAKYQASMQVPMLPWQHGVTCMDACDLYGTGQKAPATPDVVECMVECVSDGIARVPR